MSAASQQSGPRRVLLLQGPPSRFWSGLGDAFAAAGHTVYRINLSLADVLFWRRKGAVNYRGRFEDWPAYVAAFMREHGVTDVLYYGDRQPYHRVASQEARKLGAIPVSVEFGYLRPDWLTVERGGMGVFSHFPEDPDVIRAIAAAVPKPDTAVAYPYSFRAEAFGEVTFNMANVLGSLAFPSYRSDKYYNPLVEYLAWIPRLLRHRIAARHARQVEAEVKAGGSAYWLCALQLQSDYQIRQNSHFGHISKMIDEVVASFAAHAPAGGRLILKQHPLDNGLNRWPRVVHAAAQRHSCADRVTLIDGGDLGHLLEGARGCVLVNSTVGLHAIRVGCPTKVLGIAVFDIAGLTHQAPLDTFWTHPEPVDAGLAADFVRALAGTIQVKGSFYHPAGQRAGQAEIVRRVVGEIVNEPGAFVDPPPRLARAIRTGVPVVGEEPAPQSPAGDVSVTGPSARP